MLKYTMVRLEDESCTKGSCEGKWDPASPQQHTHTLVKESPRDNYKNELTYNSTHAPKQEVKQMIR